MQDDLVILSDPRPTRSDALKNRALLLEVARRLFEEQGVEAVSMTAIAEAAGVGKGTLYRHFDNKIELCMALLDHDQRELQERTFERLRASFDARADLRWFLGAVLDFVVDHSGLVNCGIPNATVNMLEHPAHLWWRLTISGLLARMTLGGERDTQFITDALYVLLSPQTVDFQQRFLHYDVERIRSGLFDTLDRLIG